MRNLEIRRNKERGKDQKINKGRARNRRKQVFIKDGMNIFFLMIAILTYKCKFNREF